MLITFNIYLLRLHVKKELCKNLNMNFKKLIILSGLALLIAPALVLPANAAPITEDHLWTGGSSDINKEDIQDELGLGEKDPREIVASVINVALGFLGIIAVVLIIYGGFLWMTAAGNDDNIAKAKSILSAGIIGLVIILAAWGLASYVIRALVTATT